MILYFCKNCCNNEELICVRFKTRPNITYNDIINLLSDFYPTVNNYASVIEIDRSTLYRKMTTEYTISPRHFIENVRLEITIKKLLSGIEKLYSIAISAGYSGENELIRVFRKRLNLTPGSVRKRILFSSDPEKTAEEFIYQIWK